MALTESQIARLIDHTLLKPEASRDDIQKLCDEALEYGFASVCVNPWNVSQAAESLRDSEVRVCSVVGFPLGATLPIVKVLETSEAIKAGNTCGSGHSGSCGRKPSRGCDLQSDS
jgi:deoxyribose-phosphate aldolase